MSEIQAQPASWRIETWFPDLSPTILKNLKIYHDELQRVGRTVSLVSAKTMGFADVIHFADSLLASHVIHQDCGAKEIYDLGGGSGFPGLVYGMLYPTKVILIEPDERKCDFMRHIASTCGLSNVEVKQTSPEKLESSSVQHCMARSTLSISKAILTARRLVPKGGVYYHIKPDTWPAEVGEIPTQLCSSWAPALVSEYKLPIGPMKFAVIKTDKIA